MPAAAAVFALIPNICQQLDMYPALCRRYTIDLYRAQEMRLTLLELMPIPRCKSRHFRRELMPDLFEPQAAAEQAAKFDYGTK
jgi:hypothetical protein